MAGASAGPLGFPCADVSSPLKRKPSDNVAAQLQPASAHKKPKVPTLVCHVHVHDADEVHAVVTLENLATSAAAQRRTGANDREQQLLDNCKSSLSTYIASSAVTSTSYMPTYAEVVNGCLLDVTMCYEWPDQTM
jgi:hypothetical protein